MARFISSFLGAVLAAAIVAPAYAHPGHPVGESAGTIALGAAEPSPMPKSIPGITGQGDYKFKVLYRADHLPVETASVLVKAHGGFAVDRRAGQGEIYFALPGAGIIQISADLTKTKMIPTDPKMKDTNMHNAGVWYNADGTPYLVFPGNEANKVFTTKLDGTLINTLDAPTAETKFDVEAVSQYFKEGKKFIPTDVCKLGPLYYITTGYSDLDYVLTATVAQDPATVAWNGLAFGGKGDGPGQFRTGHGITVSPDGKQITVADRPHAEIDRFMPDGKYVDTVKVLEGSFVCDIDYLEGLAIIGCLDGPDKTKGAPIYILKDDKIISTIMPKDDLGLERFTHVHNAVLTKVGSKFYVIAQAWNPGDFAILEQVTG